MAYTSKVIQIISQYKLIIKGGWNHGINLGDEFNVVIKGTDVKDPETGKFLGTYDLIKSKLEVTEVFEQYSVLSKLTRKVVPSAFSTMMNMGLEKERTVTNKEKLPVSENEISPIELPAGDENIHVGDLVEKINS